MKSKLKKNYENACNAYLKAFCEKHDYDFEEARDSWVASDVGGIVCIADYFVSMETIRMDIDRNVPEGEFIKWYDYDLTMHSLGAPSMNYDHWLMGSPRKSEAEIQMLEAAHKRVEDAKKILRELIEQEEF